MDWQQPLALLVVAVTAGLLILRQYRLRKAVFRQTSTCGCAGAAGPRPEGSIVYHARKGERPRLIVKRGWPPVAQRADLK